MAAHQSTRRFRFDEWVGVCFAGQSGRNTSRAKHGRGQAITTTERVRFMAAKYIFHLR